MIKINKTTKVPAILSTDGVKETNRLIDLYDANPAQYSSASGVNGNAVKKFEFKQKIYGHRSVKEQLITEQFEKCCYCDAKFTDNGFGDAEHFRPNGAYKKRGQIA